MRKINLFYAFFMLLPGLALAQSSQEIISSAGGSTQGEKIVLDWTLGEPMIETAMLQDMMVTQGFHQPILRVTENEPTAEITTRSFELNEFTLAPNPAHTALTLDLRPPLKSDIELVITNSEGMLIKTQKIGAGIDRMKIDVSGFTPGLYLFGLYDTEHLLIRSFMISKIQ